MAAAEGETQVEKLARYESVRREADLYLWYLKVQRAANGLHDDRLVESMYPVPGRLGSVGPPSSLEP